MGELPLVTIITPTYNRADLLEETIESVLAQDYPRLEYIVLDDGSTDDTRDVLARYGDRFRWESHPNMGQPRTVNRGLELANGELIGLVNSDDPMTLGAIGPIVEALQAEPDVVLAYPDWEVIDDDGAVMARVKTPEYSQVQLVAWWACFPGPGLLFRREPARRIGGWDPSFRYIPDFEFYLRLGLAGPFKRVPRFLGKWRHHEGSISTSQRGEAMVREQIRAADLFFSRADLPAEIIEVRDEALRNAYITSNFVLGDVIGTPTDRFEILDNYGKLVQYDVSGPPRSLASLPVAWRLQAEHTRCERKIALLQSAKAEREAITLWLKQMLGEQEQEVVNLRQRAHDRNERIDWLRHTEQAQDNLIANLRAMVTEQREQVERLREEINVRRASMACRPTKTVEATSS